MGVLARSKRTVEAYFEGLERAVGPYLERWSIRLLRISLGLVFLWFGLLKIIGETPVDELLAQTVPWGPDWFVPLLGVFEGLIGLALLVGRSLQVVLVVMVGHLVATLVVLVVHADMVFKDGNPLLLTFEGEFALKNLVLISGGLVLFSAATRVHPAAMPSFRAATPSAIRGGVPPSANPLPPPPTAVSPPAGARNVWRLRGRTLRIGVVTAAMALVVGIILLVASANPPDWVRPISGTSLAPEAAGSIIGWDTQSGTKLELDLTGLDRAPDGLHFELWLSGEETIVSAGTFKAPEDVTLFAGVTAEDSPTRIWVTVEPTDGDFWPTDVVVLDTGPLSG